MGTGYTRNDTANNIADGNVINASDLDGEFDAIQGAFNGTTGHSHDGTSGEGPQIAAGGIASNAVTTAKILDANITTAKIADTNVTTDKIANDAVTLGTKTSGNYVAAGATSGTGISGSVSSEGGTFTVTSNATNANTASTIVARDGSGNFSAGTITASLTGTASNAALLDSLDSTQFLRSDAADTKTSGNLSFSDNVKAVFGAGSDLQIYHDGSNSYVDEQGTGNLLIRGTQIQMKASDGTSYAEFNDSGAVSLRYSGNLKLATKSDGVLITGELQSDSLDVDGNADISGQLTMHNNVNLQDNDLLQLGSSQDLQIYHTGSNSFIDSNGVGVLFIRQNVNDQDIRIQSDDSAGGLATYIQCDGSTGVVTLNYYGSTKLATKTDGVDITGELQSDSLDVDGNADISGTLTMGGNINIQDGDALRIGTGADLRLYHDGSDSYIDDTGTGDLYIRANDQLRLQKYTGENLIVGNVDGSVQLYYDNAEKLKTASDGIYVTGNVQSSSGEFEGASNQDRITIGASNISYIINNSEEFRMESDGDFHADGDVIAFSTTVSDERLKTDIEKIENATDKVSQLNGYTFTYKADGKKSAGVIAQEVEKVLPSAVSEKELPLKMDDGVAYKTVQYDQIIGLLIESIKELKQEVNELKGV
jgi:hypothetical protein